MQGGNMDEKEVAAAVTKLGTKNNLTHVEVQNVILYSIAMTLKEVLEELRRLRKR